MKNENGIRIESQFEVRAEEDTNKRPSIIGTPIVYDSETDIGGFFKEVIERGALKGTDLKDVRFLVNHDNSKIPLARSRNNNENSTMQLKPNDTGMDIVMYPDVENNTEAKNLYSAIQRGDVTGMSFMFIAGKQVWENLDSDYPTRRIQEISKVIEVSAVTFPAYEDTTISVRNKTTLESARKELDSSKRSLDSESKLDPRIKALLTIYKK